MHRLLIVGADDWYCRDLAEKVLAEAAVEHPDLMLVHDGRGRVVQAFREVARERGIPFETHLIVRGPRQPWPEAERARRVVAARMIALGADRCLVCDPLLPPDRRPAELARMAIRAGITTTWASGTDKPLRPLADTPSLRPDPKPDFSHYWQHVHI